MFLDVIMFFLPSDLHYLCNITWSYY